MAFNPHENRNFPLGKFESMLKTNKVYFFDSEDFQEIIHYYLDTGRLALAKKAIKIGLEQHPASIELKLLHTEVLIFENKLDVAEKMLDHLSSIERSNEEIFIQKANICSKGYCICFTMKHFLSIKNLVSSSYHSVLIVKKQM